MLQTERKQEGTRLNWLVGEPYRKLSLHCIWALSCNGTCHNTRTHFPSESEHRLCCYVCGIRPDNQALPFPFLRCLEVRKGSDVYMKLFSNFKKARKTMQLV